MSTLKPCPFCGMDYAENAWDDYGSEYWVCEFCGAASGTERDEYIWNSRPIEDDLRKRIAELEALVNVSEGLYERIYEQAARIAELEAESERAKAIVSRLRDFLFDYTNLKISNSQDDRWWALVDKFDELTTESEK